jgi:recombination protein RecR
MSQGIIENLTENLMMLPGIGRKTAQRLAFHILAMPSDKARSLANAINELKDHVSFCKNCFNIADSELCTICGNDKRDNGRICVVEEPSNIVTIERSGSYNGLYHVLHGALSPLDGITPDKLRIAELTERISSRGAEEVIIATNPNTKGEMTAKYIKEVLTPLNVSISRIAYGLPMGGDIEFADEVTLRKSFEGRRSL